MSDNDYPVIFADGLLDVSHANGVFRISFGEQAGEGTVKLVGKVLIPANQLGPVLQQITSAANDISGRIQQKATPATQTRKAPLKRAKAPVARKAPTKSAKTTATRKKAPAKTTRARK